MAAGGTPQVSPPDSTPNGGTALPGRLVKRIINLYVQEGMSTYRIAEKLGVDRQRVTRALHRANVTLSPRGKGRSRPPRVANQPSELELRKLYLDERMTTPEIGRILDIPDRRVRELLARCGIERRHRGGWDRRDRIDVGASDIGDLYVQKELTAEAVGHRLGVSGPIVLRAAHSHGFPVRRGGSPSTATVELIEALYGDPDVRRTLRTNRVQIVRSPGPLWKRFPQPAPLTPALVRALYVDCGLSSFQIELITGQPSITVLRKLAATGIERRPRGGLSPFMARWRSEQTRAGRR